MVTKTDKDWWKRGVFYQIYPRSFQDTSGNGIGDLNGIINRLDYIRDLGVDGIWISPFLKSPQKDFGYDVSDYRNVDPLFGKTEDAFRLIRKADELGMVVIMDLVLSHTSDRHDWFMESRSSTTNKYADWYVWADPKPDGSPPNNWQSCFGGSAWEFDVRRGQYYLHNWDKGQPDLNYHNSDVQEAALDIVRYWAEHGVKGFRFDVINYTFHDKELRDNPANPEGNSTINHCLHKNPYVMQLHKYDISQPEALPFIERIRSVLDEYEGTFSLAEVGDDNSVKTAVEYTNSPKRLHTAYTTSHIGGRNVQFTSSLMRKALEEIYSYSDFSWPSWAFSNHDVVRVASRWAGTHIGEPDVAKLFMAILLSLKGTPFIYQGEELGLPEASLSYDDIQDPWGKYLWPEYQGRDGCRTPFPWSHHQYHAGFSEAVRPWLPIPATHLDRAVDLQKDTPDSVLHFTRNMIAFKKEHPALSIGEIEFQDFGEDIMVFERIAENQKMLCVFNLRDYEQTIDVHYDGLQDLRMYKASRTEQQITLPPLAFGFFLIQ